MRQRDEVTLAAVAIGWGTLGPIVRWIGLPAVVIAGGRCVIGAGGLWAFWSVRRRSSLTTLKAVRWRLLASGALLAAHWWALFAALDRAPVGTVFLIVYLAPVMIGAGAPLIGDPVTSRTWAAVALGIAGTVLVAGPELGGVSGVGALLALIAAVLYAIVVLVDRTLAQVIDADVMTASKLSIAGLLLLPIAAFAESDWASASLGWLVVIGLVHTAAGLAIALDVLGRLPATIVAVLLYLEPASAVLFGWWWLGEQPTLATLAGGVIIVVAGLIVGWRPDRDTMPA